MSHHIMTLEELKESVERNELTCLACNQGFEETLVDVQSDNPGLSEEDLAEAVLDRMLDENLPYGKYADEDGDEDSGERLEVRCSIREQVVSEWLAGEYRGKGEPELALARRRVPRQGGTRAGAGSQACDSARGRVRRLRGRRGRVGDYGRSDKFFKGRTACPRKREQRRNDP